MKNVHVHRWGKWKAPKNPPYVHPLSSSHKVVSRKCKTCNQYDYAGDEGYIANRLNLLERLLAPRPKYVRVGTVIDIAMRKPGEPPKNTDVLYIRKSRKL